MNVSQIVELLRDDGRWLGWPGELLEQFPRVTRRSSADGKLNCVTAWDLDEATTDAEIEEQISHFQALGQGFEWKAFSFDEPRDLLHRLQRAGFDIGPLEKVVVYDLRKGTHPFDDHKPCIVERVKDLDRLAEFRAVAETVFKKDYSLTTGQLAEALEQGRRGHDAYVAYIDGQPVSIGRLYTHPNSLFAGLYGGGTMSEFRGRGCYRAIVAARAKDAAEAESKFLVVDALPTSLPILLRLGFEIIADTWACTYPKD